MRWYHRGMQLRFTGAKLLVRTVLWALGIVVVAQGMCGAIAFGDPARQVPFAAALVDILPAAILLYVRDLGWKGIELDAKWQWALAILGCVAFGILWRSFVGYAFGGVRLDSFGTMFVWLALFMPYPDDEATGEYESAYGDSELIENVDPRSAVWKPMRS